MLRIKGLTKRYRTGDLALKGVDIDVPDAQVMALIGPSGAGKSTVIRCINRLVEPTSGSIALNDVDIVKLGSAELRRVRRRMSCTHTIAGAVSRHWQIAARGVSEDCDGPRPELELRGIP